MGIAQIDHPWHNVQELARREWRVKANGLLGEQEAARPSVVAGVGFEPTTFGL